MTAVLETLRLTLREMTGDDLPFVADMLGDPQVMRFYAKCYSLDEAREWIERQSDRYRQDGHGLWLVTEKASGEPVGQVGLVQQVIAGALETELGYLIHRPYWRRGFATEAARRCRDHAFEQLQRQMLISLIRPVNTPSLGVARKVGLTRSGRRVIHAGFEHEVLALSRETWQTRSTAD